MKVRELMTGDPATVDSDTTLGEVATLMKQQDCGSIPVVHDRRLIGIVTDRDIVIRALAAGKDPKTVRVSEVMSANPVTIGPDEDVKQAEKVMADRQIRRLPVVEKGSLVGILVTAQIARSENESATGQTLKEISAPASGKGSHARG